MEQTLVNCISQLFSLYTSSIHTLKAEILKDQDPLDLAEEEVKSLMVEDPKYQKRKIDWLKINAVEILTQI